MADERVDLDELERHLRGWVPRACRVNRDRLMYLAGREAALADRSRPRHVPAVCWPAATAVLLVLSVALAVWGFLTPRVQYVERLVVVERPPAADRIPPRLAARAIGQSDDEPAQITGSGWASTTARGASYLQLRAAVLRRGADALPVTAAGGPVVEAEGLQDLRRQVFPGLYRRRSGLWPAQGELWDFGFGKGGQL